jgi:DNA-directed RNA polymerase subunit RPC12/RpoP
MTALHSSGDDDGGWRHNPKVAIVAIAIALLAVLVYSCRSCRRTRPALPEGFTKAKAVMRYCLNCKEAFPVTGEDVRKIPGDAPEAVKARQVPCPKCGKTGTSEALQCRHCGRYFSPVAADGPPLAACPHCGRDPHKP